MAYIDRNEDGVITGYYTAQQYEGQEEIADDAPELIAYLNPEPSAEQERRAQRKAIAEKMAESGAFEVLSYQAIQYAVQEVRLNYPEQTASLTNKQIEDAMSDPDSPYHNPGFSKMKAYYDQLSSL